MLKKIPQAGLRITLGDLFSGFTGIFVNCEEKFKKAIADYLFIKHVFLLNSGHAAFYVILKVLKKLSSKKEVILPAYTAPSMILPILKTGLKPVLCDISLNSFNMDLNLLQKAVTDETLCILPTHLFGIGVEGIENLKAKFPGVFIIEDCAQSMGSKIKNRDLGSFGDIGFFSFKRGKNLSTYGGGCIFTKSTQLAEKIEDEIETLKKQGICSEFMLLFKIAALSFAVKPYVYGILFPFISSFKDNEISGEFSIEKYSDVQAGAGLSLLKKIGGFSKERHENAVILLNGLAGIKGIILPVIPGDSIYAFNRLPVVFKNVDLLIKTRKKLFENGIDTSLMYLKPIHHIFDIGYSREDFPNATYVAYRLITLPTHPMLDKKDLDKIIYVIKDTVK